MVGVFKKENYLELSENDQTDKKIFRTEEELVDYVSKWYEPSPIDENVPPDMKRMLEMQPKNAKDYVDRRIKGGLFDRAARDLGQKGKNYFCD